MYLSCLHFGLSLFMEINSWFSVRVDTPIDSTALCAFWRDDPTVGLEYARTNCAGACGSNQLEFGPLERGEQSPSRTGQMGAAGDTSNSFHAFLSRQNKMETDKLKHIEQIQVRPSGRTSPTAHHAVSGLCCLFAVSMQNQGRKVSAENRQTGGQTSTLRCFAMVSRPPTVTQGVSTLTATLDSYPES